MVLDRLNTAMLAQQAPRYITAIQATFRTTAAGLGPGGCAWPGTRGPIRRADGRVQEVAPSAPCSACSTGAA